MAAFDRLAPVVRGWKFTDYGPSYPGIQRAGGGEIGGRRFHFKDPSGSELAVWSAA